MAGVFGLESRGALAPPARARTRKVLQLTWSVWQVVSWCILARFGGAMRHMGRPRCEVFEPHVYGTLTPL
jgi:hypothetical protein